jgi:dTDP-4-dehydrorhamnose reductase
VINCIGMTDVEICESRPEAAYALNTVAPRMIAKECATRGLRFFQLSTDHFQSTTDEINDRTEITQFEATNQYSLTKLFMERQVLLANPKALVVRTNFFGYSPSSKSFFSQLVTSKSGDTFTGYKDVFFNPLGVMTLVHLLTAMSKIELTGLVHAVSNDVISKLDFAKIVLDASGTSASLVSGLLPRSYPKRPHFLALQPTESLLSLQQVGSIEDMIRTEVNRFPPSQEFSTNEAKGRHSDGL